MLKQPIRKIKLRVPASTANLGAGYDSLGLALKLFNYFEFQILQKGRTKLIIQGTTGFHELPLTRKNLVYRAMARIVRLTGVHLPPMEIKILLNIPLAKGLGSSATAIVAGMYAANLLSGERKLSQERLLREIVQLEGHPDNVTAAFFGGLTAVMRINQDFIYRRFRPYNKLKAVLVIPDYNIPTIEARKVLPEKIPHADAVSNLSRIPFIIDALCSGELDNLQQIMDDRLHQPYRKPLIKYYDQIVKAGLKTGAKAAVLSGAGPALVAFCINDAEKIATAMSDVLTRRNLRNSTVILSPDTHGTRILEMQ